MIGSKGSLNTEALEFGLGPNLESVPVAISAEFPFPFLPAFTFFNLHLSYLFFVLSSPFSFIPSPSFLWACPALALLLTWVRFLHMIQSISTKLGWER
jgi:hypothetical protein